MRLERQAGWNIQPPNHQRVRSATHLICIQNILFPFLLFLDHKDPRVTGLFHFYQQLRELSLILFFSLLILLADEGLLLQYVFFGRDRVLHGMLTMHVMLVTLCFRDINHSWELAHVCKSTRFRVSS